MVDTCEGKKAQRNYRQKTETVMPDSLASEGINLLMSYKKIPIEIQKNGASFVFQVS